ncbi:MAG: type II secretion system protein GspG [Polyangiales bacterium]
MARRRHRERISLPWEGRGPRWRGAFNETGWKPLLGLLILAALALGSVEHTRHRIRVRDTQVAIAQVKQAIDRFRADLGRCPQSDTELLHPPVSQKHYIDSIPKDGWRRPLFLRCPGTFEEEAEVISAGPSGSLLKDDNIQ